MFKDKVILINVIVFVALLSILAHLLTLEYVVERNVVYDTTLNVKTQHRASESVRSVVIGSGYDRQVQHTLPAWSFHSQYLDNAVVSHE